MTICRTERMIDAKNIIKKKAIANRKYQNESNYQNLKKEVTKKILYKRGPSFFVKNRRNIFEKYQKQFIGYIKIFKQRREEV